MNLKTYQITGSQEQPTIIMLHGYGANGRDLISLATPFKNLNLNWLFLEAPLSPPELALFGGKAWFNLTLSKFSEQMASQNFEAFYKSHSPEFTQSLETIKHTLWELDLKTDLYIGGFSQGAMMAANLFFDDPSSYKKLILFSGAPLKHPSWTKLSTPKPAFVSHGHQDQVLPFQCGQDLAKTLKDKNLTLTTTFFQGGHEIPIETLHALGSFLTSK